jgi:FKBP-type peptidyl-prolyl cis-trans isomerase
MHIHFSLLRHAAAFSVLLGFATACTDSTEATSTASNPATETFAPSLGVNISQMTKISDDLYIQDLIVGTGAVAASGRSLQVTYTGWLANGTQFGSNVGKSALTITLGAHDVIERWDLVLVGMKVGGKRRLVIGSALGYGPGGNAPAIPPNSTLVFDVQLLSAQLNTQ